MEKEVIGHTYVLFHGAGKMGALATKLSNMLPVGAKARFYTKGKSKNLYIDIDHTDHDEIAKVLKQATDLPCTRKAEQHKTISYIFNESSSPMASVGALNAFNHLTNLMRQHQLNEQRTGLKISECTLTRHVTDKERDAADIYITIRANDHRQVEQDIRRIARQGFGIKPGYAPK